MSVTIYHNPDCGTSRNTLAMIRQSGVEPVVVEYLRSPPHADTIIEMVGNAGLTLAKALRQKGTPFADLGLGEPGVTDVQRLEAIAAHPILLNRPFVVAPKGTRLCRPSEVVLDVLDNPDIGPFTKEDGEVIIDAAGQRIV
ncbi:arsenate reductase (glutaredoxin) [Devosia rhodophyticola]|uniref:Arsenate reductase n=1 Tax=Devosia rhodophyticola TaxID=3026423 RepID=A0ABY7YTA3_9HYPH|nr:arsenate reductase (glutaredoxin) [Devosia rhodophyticola]WDR04608.1 arsenate reductase (glutaredoxin) [Devosia rhodophyticola]